MDPTEDDMTWMTERARDFMSRGMAREKAIRLALNEGEERARRREHAKRQALEGRGRPTLHVKLGDAVKWPTRRT